MLLAALAPARRARAQSDAAAGPGQALLASLLQPFGGLGDDERSAIARGAVVTRVLPTTDRNEVAMLGVVAVQATAAQLAARARDGDVWPPAPTRTSASVLGAPPAVAEVAQVALDEWELKSLGRCRREHCGVKLPSDEMAVLRRLATDGDAAARARTDSAFRAWLVNLVTEYERQGSAALPTYDDTRVGEHGAVGLRVLVRESAPLLDLVPGLDSAVLGPPTVRPDLQTTLYWEVDRPRGLRPILSIDARTTSRPAALDGGAMVVTEQLYATHYFDARLDVQAVVPDGASGAYVLVLRRVMFDELPSGGMFSLRKRVTSRLRNALEADLTRGRDAIEGAGAHDQAP